MADAIRVMISSTTRDLPVHRGEVRDACLRQGMFPIMMEHLPAKDADAIQASLDLVDQAKIYLGVFAHHYGYMPAGHNISITEMEYNRAVERGIPRLIALMHDDHPLKAADVERGEGASKLEAFKERLKAEQIVSFFKSPEDLRAHVISSLSHLRQPEFTNFHYVSDIPPPPELYVAHPYTLLQTHTLVGRQEELNLLSDWVSKSNTEVFQARILSIVAIGGMGKSALTWKWFNDIAPHEMLPLAGRLWWSFYESDASFENFIIRALAYVTGKSKEAIQQVPQPEREEQLLSVLDREPFLFVLDGLERVLLAYARMDAARLADDDLDHRTANQVSGVAGAADHASPAFVGYHRLRKTADPRAGSFLRKLAGIRAARILVSTRLYPADLQSVTGHPIPGSDAYFLKGLSDDDAINLWRVFEVSGSREILMPMLRSFDKHPLLVQALASEVAHYRRAPGDFDRWRQDHPSFDPFRLPLVQVKSHVLEFALRGLNPEARKLIHTIAAFRMPASYDTLLALMVGEGKQFQNENGLDIALTELEDRGLLGWDKRANRYDLHPIVRGVTWSGLDDTAQRNIFATLNEHFGALPATESRHQVQSLDDLAVAIELYHTLIGLGRYDDAYEIFRVRIHVPTAFRLSANRQHAEMLEQLFPDGLDALPRLSRPEMQVNTLSALAGAYGRIGQPGRAVELLRKQLLISEQEGTSSQLWISLESLSRALYRAGALRESEEMAHKNLRLNREYSSSRAETILQGLGLTLATRGKMVESEVALRRVRLKVEGQGHSEGVINYMLAQRAYWMGDYRTALLFAERAWDLARLAIYEGDFIRALRLKGVAWLGLNELSRAGERLYEALTRARAANFIEEELPILIGLAKLKECEGDLKAARELLGEVWQPAEDGPYPLFAADAYNVLAQIERTAGLELAAIEAARKAYRLAWCDGPPFAYHWGLELATEHLAALGAS